MNKKIKNVQVVAGGQSTDYGVKCYKTVVKSILFIIMICISKNSMLRTNTDVITHSHQRSHCKVFEMAFKLHKCF